MNNDIDVIEINDNPDLLDETFEILNKRLDILDQLNKKTKELELLKMEHQKLLDNNEKNNYKEKERYKKIKELTEEINKIKQENIDLQKKILMLKTLIKIVFKEYGMESILKTTKLSLEQIKKYLD
ncbi:MAG: hypothetical protein E7157_03050 [Lactobacillales bacterium]|nr:hypothetical protein [Lactobacillales bacterium]